MKKRSRGDKIIPIMIVLTILVSVAFLAYSSFKISSQALYVAGAGSEISAESIATKREFISALPADDDHGLTYFNKDPSKIPKVGATSYLVGDLDTGEIILAKNINEVFPIASTSKLMTALVATELPSDRALATVSKRALSTYGGNGNFRAGEKVNVADLIYPLLIESSNDAAEILAEHFERENFIGKMNQQAEKLLMTSTTYDDPSGLSPENVSTATDLFKLIGHIYKSRPDLLTASKVKSYSTKTHRWPSVNKFIKFDGYQGGKTGYTDQAQETAISVFSIPLAEDTSRSVGIIILHSNDRTKDTANIINYLKKYIYYGGESDAELAWVKQKDGVPEIRDPDYINFAFMGDIMVDRGVRSSVIKNFNGDYSQLFVNMDILKNSDIVFANLEGPASDKGKDLHNLYSFRMDPSIIPALAGAGFNVLSMANNHVGDWGRDAYIDTLARLRENEILYAGGGANSEEAEQPAVMKKYGMKIGFLAFTDVGPDWMKATEDNAGTLLASNPRFDEIVSNAVGQVDHLVVSFHFGDEYKPLHNKRQEYLAHRAIDNGAKIVIGSHPHVEEDYEVYNHGYIAYSLGNLIFDQKFSGATMQGALLLVKLWRDGSLDVTKNTVKLNSAFLPSEIIRGKEERVNFTNY